jgi:hypothetical protein
MLKWWYEYSRYVLYSKKRKHTTDIHDMHVSIWIAKAFDSWEQEQNL